MKNTDALERQLETGGKRSITEMAQTTLNGAAPRVHRKKDLVQSRSGNLRGKRKSRRGKKEDGQNPRVKGDLNEGEKAMNLHTWRNSCSAAVHERETFRYGTGGGAVCPEKQVGPNQGRGKELKTICGKITFGVEDYKRA